MLPVMQHFYFMSVSLLLTSLIRFFFSLILLGCLSIGCRSLHRSINHSEIQTIKTVKNLNTSGPFGHLFHTGDKFENDKVRVKYCFFK